MYKMLAILVKSLNVFLSRMYNELSIINQVASLSPLAGGPCLEAFVLRGLAQGPPPWRGFALLPYILSSRFNDFSTL